MLFPAATPPSRSITRRAAKSAGAAVIPACALYLALTGQAAALALLDSGGNRLGASVEVKSSITFTPTEGSGSYSVTAAPNAQGVTPTITANGDGSYTFTRQTTGAWAGYYMVMVTDTAAGDACPLMVAVPPEVAVSTIEMLGINGQTDVRVYGGSAGLYYTLRAMDVNGTDATGVVAAFDGDPTAWDYPEGSNLALVPINAINPVADTRLYVTATAPGLPQGKSNSFLVVASELFTGTVRTPNGPAYPTQLTGEGRRTTENEPYQIYGTDENGNFSVPFPKGTTTIVAASAGYAPVGAPAADCLQGCTLTLGTLGTDQLVAQRVDPLVDSTAMRIPLTGFASMPVVIAGVPTFNVAAPGVARVSNVKRGGFDLRFKEWDYLDGRHGEETISALALAPGRYNLPDGSQWEVGTFALGNTGVFRNVTFGAPFLGTPRVFLTVQSENETDAVTVRAKAVTATGFRAALFEEEAKMDGHVPERVGYVAIYNAFGGGYVNIGGINTYYQLWGVRNDGFFRATWDNVVAFRLQEEQSLDSEIAHPYEAVDLMYMEGSMFGQDVSSRNSDTVALRRRHP